MPCFGFTDAKFSGDITCLNATGYTSLENSANWAGVITYADVGPPSGNNGGNGDEIPGQLAKGMGVVGRWVDNWSSGAADRVRAATAQGLVKDVTPDDRPRVPALDEHSPVTTLSDDTTTESDRLAKPSRSLTISLMDVPSAKTRDVVRGAVLPLAKANPVVEVDVVIRVDGGTAGVAPDDLDLSILEALRQLGLEPRVVREPE